MLREGDSNKKNRLFADSEIPHGIVVLNWHGQSEEEFKLFAKAYHQTAKEAIDRLREKKQFGLFGNPIDDFLAYPVVFLYRHALELNMKAVILAGTPMVQIRGEKPIKRESVLRMHSLEKLRQAIESVFAAYDWKWDLGTPHFRSLTDFRKVITEFATVDAGSYTFRYPTDTEGKPALNDYFRFNIFDFCEALDDLLPVLNGLAYGAYEELQAAYREMAEAQQYELGDSD